MIEHFYNVVCDLCLWNHKKSKSRDRLLRDIEDRGWLAVQIGAGGYHVCPACAKNKSLQTVKNELLKRHTA